MTFSIVVAYGVFVLTTIILLALIVNALIPKSDFEKLQENLQSIKTGRTTKIDWRKVFVLFLLWVASGVFLFG
jgi:hypothetical protein